MHVKFVVSTIISFVGITLALGYFGLSTSISSIRDKVALEETGTTTEPLPLAPEGASLPPADPARPGLEFPAIFFPKFPLAPDKTITLPAAPAPVVPAPRPPTPSVSPTYPSTPIAPSTKAPLPNEDEDAYVGDARSFAQGALVNILCSPSSGSALRKSISGTGVIIDARGIILTVAHVGQYFLLEDYPETGNADCIIRTGSPARNSYDAKLIYVSPSWVEVHPSALAQAAPRGNGKDDFALLAITKSITSRSLPASFTAVPFSSSAPEEGDAVGIGSYGAEFLSGKEIVSSLYPIVDDGNVADVYTYGDNAVDVISVRGSKAAQSGSSGGGVVNTDGRFVGLISTSSLGGATLQRTLYAITPDHIRASFKADTGKNLDSYLKGNLATLVTNYDDEEAELAKLVWDSIE